MIFSVNATTKGVHGNMNNTSMILNVVCAFATLRPRFPPEILKKKLVIGSSAILSPVKMMILPNTLNKKWIIAARFAPLLPLKLASNADTQDPILHPRIIKKQIGRLNNPCDAINKTILTVTEELCKIAVMINPNKTPRKWLSSV